MLFRSEISGYDLENRLLNLLADRIFECEDSESSILLIEQWLTARIKSTLKIKRIGAALSAMLRFPSASVDTIASVACLGHKQFGRLFRECVGINPKEYGRIVRFQRSLRMMQFGSVCIHHNLSVGITHNRSGLVFSKERIVYP